MISFSFTGQSDQRVVEFLEQSTPRILAAIEPALRLAMEDLKTYIAANKLQGQVLKSHKNGAGLAGSLNVRIDNDGTTISGYVGTAIIYARIHELGFQGAEYVNEHTQMRTQVFGRAVAPYLVFVRGHERQMDMPARPYLAPSLQEKREAIIQRIRDAITEALAA